MKYCVFDLDGTLTYTKNEISGADVPPYTTLTDIVYTLMIPDQITFGNLMQEWREISEISEDKLSIARIYNEKIIKMIPKEKQSNIAFFDAAYEATNRFIESGIIIKPAIEFLIHMLSSGKTCIISTASFHSAAEGFIRALTDSGLIPSHLLTNIQCIGTKVDWNTLIITCYNTGSTKLATLSAFVGDEDSCFMAIGDEPFAGDNALLSLDTFCFARQKADSNPGFPKLPNKCVWTTWDNLLRMADDIATYHESQVTVYAVGGSATARSRLFSRLTGNIMLPIMPSVLELWNYHQMQHKITMQADCIIGLGSYDLTVVDKCVELYFQSVAKKILFSGKFGNWTHGLWEKTEAETFADRAIAMGVPETDILIEKESTNIGENIRFSRAMLCANGIEAETIVVVTKPNTERRGYATCKKVWPEVNVTLSSPKKELNQLTMEQLENLINEMMGDLERIMQYPELGYQISQKIPTQTMQAYTYLVEKGYTKHSIKKIETMEEAPRRDSGSVKYSV